MLCENDTYNPLCTLKLPLLFGALIAANLSNDRVGTSAVVYRGTRSPVELTSMGLIMET